MSSIDILPADGMAAVIKLETIDDIFDRLLSGLAWQKKAIRVYGRTVEQPRLVAWYGDEGTTYTYSGTKNDPLPWTSDLLEVRTQVEMILGIQFNSVLANLYRDGRDSIGFHSDDEPELGVDPIIASVSFGGEREIIFRHKWGEHREVRVPLRDHELLVMAGKTQKNWKHGIHKVASAEPRINLTFRRTNA